MIVVYLVRMVIDWLAIIDLSILIDWYKKEQRSSAIDNDLYLWADW